MKNAEKLYITATQLFLWSLFDSELGQSVFDFPSSLHSHHRGRLVCDTGIEYQQCPFHCRDFCIYLTDSDRTYLLIEVHGLPCSGIHLYAPPEPLEQSKKQSIDTRQGTPVLTLCSNYVPCRKENKILIHPSQYINTTKHIE